MTLDLPTIGILIAAPFIVFGIYLGFRAAREKLAKQLAPLARVWNAPVVKDLLMSYLVLNEDGVELRVIVTSGSRSRGHYPYLELRKIRPIGFKMLIHVEHELTEGFKDLGLLEDVTIGDSSFDERFFLRAGDSHQAQLYFQSDRRRQAIHNLFDLGFSFVEATKKYVSVQKIEHEKEDLKPENVRRALDALHVLV
jgi:hypothetical protein